MLRGVKDALHAIYREEGRVAGPEQVRVRGWGKPVRNANEVIGMSVFYGESEEVVLIGVEARRARYVHAPLQTEYLSADEDAFAEGDGFVGGEVLGGRLPNWIVMEANMELLPTCSFVMDLDPPVVMSVHGAKRVCEIVGYGGWNDVMEGVVKEEWVESDTTLEDLLVTPQSTCLVLMKSLIQSRQTHESKFRCRRAK